MPASTDTSVLSTSSKGSLGVVKQSDQRFDPENLDELEQKVAEAEDFIIYGRASVEMYDDDATNQLIKMEAFEDKIDQFFEQDGVISLKHSDVRVGKALREYTLESPTTIELGDETFSFDEGDTLETKVDHENNCLWLVANLYGDGHDAGTMARLKSLRGELGGFSVTIRKKEWENTRKGQVITDIDFYSATVGTEEEIKNKESLYGVAEYKAGSRFAQLLNLPTRTKMFDNVIAKLRSKSNDMVAEQTVLHALTETGDLHASAKAMSDGEDVEQVEQKAGTILKETLDGAESKQEAVDALMELGASEKADVTRDTIEEKLDELDEEAKQFDEREVAEMVAEVAGVEVGEALEMMEELRAEGMEDEDPEEDVEEEASDEDEDEDEDMEDKAESEEDEPESEVESKSEDESEADAEDSVEQKSEVSDEIAELIDAKLEAHTEAINERIEAGLENATEQVAEDVMDEFSSKAETTPEADASEQEEETRSLLDGY